MYVCVSTFFCLWVLENLYLKYFDFTRVVDNKKNEIKLICRPCITITFIYSETGKSLHNKNYVMQCVVFFNMSKHLRNKLEIKYEGFDTYFFLFFCLDISSAIN